MPDVAGLGLIFIAASVLLFVTAVRLDQRLHSELPPVLRTPRRINQESWLDDDDAQILALVEAVPVRWRRELYPPRHRAAIDAFCIAVLLTFASAVAGAILISLSILAG